MQPEAAADLQFVFRLLLDSQEVTIRRSAALQILVFLAVHPDGATTTQLVHALWPGLPARTVTGRLYTTLSDLRSTVRATSVDQVVVHTEGRFHLEPRTDVDLWWLQAAAHHSATTDAPGGWQPAMDAYTGELAAGHTWPWIDPDSDRNASTPTLADVTAADGFGLSWRQVMTRTRWWRVVG
ncbi:AfsR/SARP family transcriptional regulator [Micromonospora sp. DT31]|uniref:AfsR/SARP family transcriptional regulator n=1 Tax=Micromonospora sp. DT31 TaxID=3393434 RepID=UPI003CFB4093